MPGRRLPTTAEELLRQYDGGIRDFSGVQLPHAEFESLSLVDVNLSSANLTGALFGDVSLKRVCLDNAMLAEARMYDLSLTGCTLRRADLSACEVGWNVWDDNDLSGASLSMAVFRHSDLGTGTFTRALLDTTLLINCDIRGLCRADPALVHMGPSYVDHTTIVRSLLAPNLADFLLRTGMPPIFVEYAIDCARATDNPVLSRMMRSTFISYGTPDEAFARKLYEALHANGVTTFFFPEHAVPGKRLHRVMREGVNQHDRVVLVCSEASLTRPGVLNEIEETLAREAREGGETYLVPIRLDDYVFTGWAPSRPDLAQAIRDRVVADFTGALTDENQFNTALLKLLSALKR